MVSLQIQDNGPGFPDEIKSNTGIDLIEALVRYDLRGTVTFGRGDLGGASVDITFPKHQINKINFEGAEPVIISPPLLQGGDDMREVPPVVHWALSSLFEFGAALLSKENDQSLFHPRSVVYRGDFHQERKYLAVAEPALTERLKAVKANLSRSNQMLGKTDGQLLDQLDTIGHVFDFVIRTPPGGTVSRDRLIKIIRIIQLAAHLNQEADVQGKTTFDDGRIDMHELITSILRLKGSADFRLTSPSIRCFQKSALNLGIALLEWLDNAQNFGSSPVSISGQSTDDDYFHLTISNEGPGFDKNFDPIRDTKTGLAIADEMMLLAFDGSDVTYSNRVDGGCTIAEVNVLIPNRYFS